MPDSDFFSQSNKLDEQGSQLPDAIPVIEEFISVEKKWIETDRIKIKKRVEEKTEAIDVNLLSEEYNIEYVVINQYVDEVIPQARQEGDTFILPVLKEVIIKRLLLVEEIKITKKTTERQEQHNVVLRKESVDISRSSPDL